MIPRIKIHSLQPAQSPTLITGHKLDTYRTQDSSDFTRPRKIAEAKKHLMWRLFFVVLFACTGTRVFSQQLMPFSMNGKFGSNAVEGKIYLMYEIDGKGKMDSSFIKKGVFFFSGHILHPEFAILAYNNLRADLFLSPNSMTATFKNLQLKDLKITNSKSDAEFREIDKSLLNINKRWQTVLDTLDAVSKRSLTSFQELKDWVLLPYFEECREAYLGFFSKHRQSFVTAYYLSQNAIEMNQGVFPVDSLQAYYNGFARPVKNSWYGKKISEELISRKVAVPGTAAFEFTRVDINGQKLSLSSFRGKYVLLDFWGSWCVPCRKGNPHLKELYSRYKDKGFDIIGIAKDDHTNEAWLKAVKTDGLPWHHVLCGNLDEMYHITSYPTKILLDTKGTIIGRFGEDEEGLDKLLISIFNEKH